MKTFVNYWKDSTFRFLVQLIVHSKEKKVKKIRKLKKNFFV